MPKGSGVLHQPKLRGTDSSRFPLCLHNERVCLEYRIIESKTREKAVRDETAVRISEMGAY